MSDDLDKRATRIDQAVTNLDEIRLNDVDTSEDSLALGFCALHPDYRHVYLWNKWMRWTGTVWTNDETTEVYDAIRAYVRRATDAEKEWMKAATISAVERFAKSDRRYAAVPEQWDVDDWAINTPGGIVDLRTGELSPSDPESYVTKTTTAAPGSDCPAWLRFLDDVTDGDDEYVRFLQRIVGYSLTGSTREHAMFFAYGPGGNGKGVFLNTLTRILGEYAIVSSMDTFTESYNDRHPTDLAMLRGARMVVAQETEEGRAWAETRIKALTGGDPITARFMRADFFTFTPKFKLLISGNHKPVLKNPDEAMRRRLHLLPFNVTFGPDRRDPDLGEKLLDEAGGILQWAIDGALAYQNKGLNPPKVAVDATAEYFEASDIFTLWLGECCEVDPNVWDTPRNLFASWRKFAEDCHEKAGKQRGFSDRLKATGFDQALPLKSRGGRSWEGLRVKPERVLDHW